MEALHSPCQDHESKEKQKESSSLGPLFSLAMIPMITAKMMPPLTRVRAHARMEAGQRAQGREGGGGHAAPFFFLPCPFGELVRFANCPLVNPAFYSLLLPSPVLGPTNHPRIMSVSRVP